MIVEYRLRGSQLVPVRFGLSGIEHEVAEILDRWPGEDHLYFKVRTTDDDLYILRFDTNGQEWEISVFKEGDQRPAARIAGGVRIGVRKCDILPHQAESDTTEDARNTA